MSLNQFISSDGVRLAYDTFGRADGTPTVLCHGLGAAGEQFFADAEFFASRGHYVLVPDLRGHARSGTPANVTPQSVGLPRLAADLFEMLDDAGLDQVDWVGNSLGGIVALEMLKAKRFRSLATFGTSYALNLPRLGVSWVLPLSYRIFGVERLAVLTARTTTRLPEARRLLEKMLRETRPEVMTAMAVALTRYDLTNEAAAAGIPILMLRCEEDRAVNRALGGTLLAMQSRPNFQLVEIAGGSHVANLDATDSVRDALMAFWRSMPG